MLFRSNKEVKRIDTQSNDCENQEDYEIAKSCGHKAVPFRLMRFYSLNFTAVPDATRR